MSQPSVGQDEVRHVAGLARIDLDDEEVAQFAEQFADILDYFETLDEVPEIDAEADLVNVMRADEVRTFKPDASLYRHAAERTDTPIDGIAHVSAGWFDVLGAEHAGMQGVWIDRDDRPWEPFGGDPAITIESIHDLAAELGV